MRALILLMIAIATNVTVAEGVHTWHNVVAEESEWQGTLSFIHQSGYFVDRNYNKLSTFALSPHTPITYGFVFNKDATFDVAYTLTLTEKNTRTFQSKTCVFVITAEGPAKPDIKALAYHGATCNYHVVKGVGEDFFVR